MKKKTEIILIVIALIVLLVTWSCIKRTDIKSNRLNNNIVDDKDIVNGEYISSTGTAEYLFSLKTIGDNSAVGKLLDTLDIRMYGHYTFELKNKILVINYSQVEGWGNILNQPEITIEKSAILLALIDNVDEIHWVLPNSKKITKITINDLKTNHGNIKDYGKSNEDLKLLLKKLGYYNDDEPITMSIDTVTNVGVNLIIKNHTDNEYLYGESYSIERSENGKWNAVDLIVDSCDVNLIGYILKAEQETEKKENWEYCYDRLPKGQYRITKDFRYISPETDNVWNGKKYIISAEFII